MGNTVIKDEGDLIGEVDSLYIANGIRVNSLQVSENLRSSSTSTPSDFSFSLEDAVSVTDSTNTADYESAYETDTSFSNTMLACTDITYNTPANVKTVKNQNSEPIHGVEALEIDKVSCPRTVENFVFENLSSDVCVQSNSKKIVAEACLKNASVGGNEVHGWNNELSSENKRASPELNFSMPRNRENSKWKFAKTDETQSGSSERNTPNTRAPRSQVYKEYLVLNYEKVFMEKAKQEYVSNNYTCANFDQIGNVLSGALNKISTMLETSAVRSDDTCFMVDSIENDTLFDKNIMEAMPLYDMNTMKYLNTRYRHSAFFEFTYGNVFVLYNDMTYKLDEYAVEQFFSNRFAYSAHLNCIRFVLKCEPESVRYVADISHISERNIFQLEMIINPLKANLDAKNGDRSGGECSFVNNNDNECSISDFSSLQSEIIDCAFQLGDIYSDIMNCNENVSEAGPATAADIDNIKNVPFLNDDFISKFGGTGNVAEELRKQSLYVKFDPLVAEEVNSSLNNDDTLKLNNSNMHNDRNELKENVNCEIKLSEEKNISNDFSDSKINENGNIGKLISVTPTKSPRRNTPKSSPRFPETDPDDVSKLQSLLLKQMKKEEAFKEELESLRRENEQVSRKLQNSNEEVNKYKALLEAVQDNEKKLKNELKERIKSKQQLSSVMEDYEKTISQMLNKREDEKKEFDATVKKVEADRDSTMQHLNNLENAFNDIHQKYERGKAVNEALKKNEDLLKKSLSEYESTVKTVENKYELLKSHATSQLEKANQELELITQSYEKEQAKLKALLRKSEIQINSLQNALDRKTKENQELAAICDELIIKLSSHSST